MDGQGGEGRYAKHPKLAAPHDAPAAQRRLPAAQQTAPQVEPTGVTRQHPGPLPPGGLGRGSGPSGPPAVWAVASCVEAVRVVVPDLAGVPEPVLDRDPPLVRAGLPGLRRAVAAPHPARPVLVEPVLGEGLRLGEHQVTSPLLVAAPRAARLAGDLRRADLKHGKLGGRGGPRAGPATTALPPAPCPPRRRRRTAAPAPSSRAARGAA